MSLDQKASPMMMQWQECKKNAPNALVFFRLGDFYEAFYDDAEIVAKELNITLTKRQDVPMSGIPHHSSEIYIDRLVLKGYRIAIAEQLEAAKPGKGLVKREIVRFISPGTLIDSGLLQEKNNNFFISIYPLNETFGLAILDLSTGEFRWEEVEEKQSLGNELFRFRPSELLTSEKCSKHFTSLFEELKSQFPLTINTKAEYFFDHKICFETLLSHFQVSSLDHFGLKGRVAAINAAGALFNYLKKELRIPLNHVRTFQPESFQNGLLIDRTTQKHLELFGEKEESLSLLTLIDHTKTPMGGRLLKKWLSKPLTNLPNIKERQQRVESLFSCKDLGSLLHPIRDLERLSMRIETGHLSPRDLNSFAFSLDQIPSIKTLLPESFESLNTELISCSSLVQKIKEAIVEEPPLRIHEGDIFKKGYSAELDALRELNGNHLIWLNRYQQELREHTGIKNLRISFTKAFGYYIEVSKGQAEKMPLDFERTQTLTNNERFTTKKLREFEQAILTAEEDRLQLEKRLFEEFRVYLSTQTAHIKKNAQILAEIDCLWSLREVALKHGFKKPIVDESDDLFIEEGRHPLIESLIPRGTFVPNDLNLGEERLALITGPNMAGKSTFIRQVALIVILAQMGSFVPAEKARIGLVDKLFSRIGASDDLTRGQSTFMVEMLETSYILHQATPRSLIILDEIGRGTSTYDGISIAWSVAEYLVSDSSKRAKTLFATHYLELADLSSKFKEVLNLHVAVEESGSEVVFLHRILPGVANKSYGIHVAKLAGLPFSVIKRAQEMLASLEKKEKSKIVPKAEQLFLFQNHPDQSVDTLLSELKLIDIHSLTPLAAQQKLGELIKHALEF